MKQCGTCKFFALHDFDVENDPDAMGECTWKVLTLPYSMRYANRERTPVYVDDGKSCPAYEAKE